MVVWKHGISWDKMKKAIDCPLQMQNAMLKKPATIVGQNYYRELGNFVQFVFENYFNQGINLKPGGANVKVLRRVAEKIYLSAWWTEKTIEYPHHLKEEDFKKSVDGQLEKALEALEAANMMGLPLQSEKIWSAMWGGIRTFAKLDFQYVNGNKVRFWDGKGYAKMNADPRQLLWYGVSLMASNLCLEEAGFLYWKHGEYKEVDVSPAALKEFVDEHVRPVLPMLVKLRTGMDEFKATPSKEACFWCNWRNTCPFSAVKQVEADLTGPPEVGFGEIKNG